MPVVAPKVKVVRVTNISRGGNVSVIDIGVINSPDVAATGFIELKDVNTNESLAGKIIEEITFLPDNFSLVDHATWYHIATPNTLLTGFGLATLVWGVDPLDTFGKGFSDGWPRIGDGVLVAPSYGGGSFHGGLFNRFRTVGPLYALEHIPPLWFGYTTWRSGAGYMLLETVVKLGNLFYITTNGFVDTTEPNWSSAPNPNDTLNDGSAVWTNWGPVPTQDTIHARALVSTPSPGYVQPIASSIEFVQQPTNTAANATITPSPSIRVLDQNGQPYTMIAPTISIGILGTGTLSGTTPVAIDQTTGIATFTDLSIAETGTGYILRAYLNGGINVRVDSAPFNVTAP